METDAKNEATNSYAFFDLDERWLPMGNGIFHFGCTAFDGITGRTILAEVYPYIKGS